MEDFPIPSYEEWKEAAIAALKGKPFEKMYTKTYEGITLNPMYRKEDAENLEQLKNNLPGAFPFLRGTRADGYKKTAWDVSQETNYTLPEELNEAIREDTKRGQNEVNFRINSDVIAQVKNGKAEMSCPSTVLLDLDDMKKAFDGVCLKCNKIHLTAKRYPLVYFSLLNAYLKSKDMSLADVKGVFSMDPLGSLATFGEIPHEPDKMYKMMTRVLNYVVAAKSELRTIEVKTTIYNNGGANAVQEVAYALATAAEYMRGMQAAGADVKDIAKHLLFTVGIGANFFMEIAKFRALRMLWAFVAKEFGADECGQKINMHTKTTYMNFSKLDQYVNMLRVTTETLSAVIGGTDSNTVNQFDCLFGLPKDFSRRIARNVSLLLREECNMRYTVDPAGGSWYVENLTAEIAKAAYKMFQDIEANGGMYAELKAGKIQSAVKAVQAQRIKAMSSRKDVLIGVNRYPNGNEKPVDVIPFDTEKAFNYASKKCGCPTAAKACTGLSKDMPKENKIDAITNAFLHGANVFGVVDSACGCCCGEKVTADKIDCTRLAEPFEQIREASAKYKAEHGFAPKIFLANMGPLRQHKPRADFSQDFFATGGFEVLYNQGFETPKAAADAAIASDAKIIVICSTDDDYPNCVPEIAKSIKAAAPDKYIVLAGYPADFVEAFKADGVDEFIHVKASIYNILLNVQKKLGIA